MNRSELFSGLSGDALGVMADHAAPAGWAFWAGMRICRLMAEWERKLLAHFGCFDSGFERQDDERPLIRLACQAQANGSVSIVIPPWCGVPGRGRAAQPV